MVAQFKNTFRMVQHMANINTTTGPVSTADLGRTLIHEHVLVGFPGWFLDNRQPAFKRDEALSRVVDAFQQLRDYNVETVVDPCPMDLGRDVEFVAEVSQRSGINLICTTGVYYEAAGIPYTFKFLSEDEIAEIYIKEIEDGVGETGIKVGAIKIATGNGKVSKYERKVLTAAAKAAKATGVPVISHTEKCTCGHDQIDIITGGGVAADCLLVGHSDGTDDVDYQASLAERGVFVGFDRFGLETDVSDEIRMKNIKILADRGYLGQIMVSHDMANCWLGGIPGMPVGAQLTDVMPNWNMTHIFERILPQLKDLGMTDVDFDCLLAQNPQRFFGA